MAVEPRRSAQQRQRLAAELAEIGLELDPATGDLALDEIDYALRPIVHEQRIPTYGAVIDPASPTDRWEDDTGLVIDRRPIDGHAIAPARRYADGLASWLVRRRDGNDEWAIFDRPAGSERDLMVLAEAFGGLVVQRHPVGLVRVANDAGVFRYDGMGWRFEPSVTSWIDLVHSCTDRGERDVLRALLEFAVHDLGARGIGAILVYRPDEATMLAAATSPEASPPPPIEISHPTNLAPLRHALGQVDGATLFDESGTLRHLGVRLVPSAEAESALTRTRGMRHTAAHGYSYDDPGATVIVVSEDGPVTVLRGGEILGTSAPGTADA